MSNTTHPSLPAGCEAHRGALLHFLADPGNGPEPAAGSVAFFEDGLLVIQDGKVVTAGAAAELLPLLPAGTEVTRWDHRLLVPGFIDTHVHMPQLGVIASYGTQLLDWLETYTFPTRPVSKMPTGPRPKHNGLPTCC